MAVLDIGAKRREEWLYDIYRMGRDAITRGGTETYVVADAQWDPGDSGKDDQRAALGRRRGRARDRAFAATDGRTRRAPS